MKVIINGDKYVINGEKCWIMNVSYVWMVIVIVVIGKSKEGKNIIFVLIVLIDIFGFMIMSLYDKMGVCGLNIVEILFEDVRVFVCNLFGDLIKGFK